jgi:hypothetical protein
MIAQRKPNNDKGFEDFMGCASVLKRIPRFLMLAAPQTGASSANLTFHALRRANALRPQTQRPRAFAAVQRDASGRALVYCSLRRPLEMRSFQPTRKS